MIGSGQDQSSSIYRYQAFSWDRLRATMAETRGLQADRDRTIGEVSSVDEADYGEAFFNPDMSKALPMNPRPPMGSGLCMTRRPPKAYFAPGSARVIKPRAPSIPSGRSSSELDRRFSTASAIPAGLKLKPYTLPATVYDRRTGKASMQPTLRSIPQSPENAVIPKTLRRSEGQIARELKQVTFSPTDLVHPPGAFGNEEPKRYGTTPKTWGLNCREGTSELESLAEAGDFQASPQSMDSFSAPPHGGWLVWSHALAGFFVAFNTWGLNMSFGVFQAYYTFYMLPGIAPEQIAWIGSLQLFLLLILARPIGLAMDRGWFRICFNGGSVLLILSIFMTSLCTKWWELFLVQGLLTGTAMSMISYAASIISMSHFKENIGIATALDAAGSSIGALVYSITLQQLLTVENFPWTMRINGFIALATLSIPNLLMRPLTRPTPQTQKVDFSSLRNLPHLTTTAGLFFTFWGLHFTFYFLPSFAITTLHLPGAEAVTFLIAMCAANLPGCLTLRLLSDRCLGPLNTLIASCIVSAVITFLWIASSSRASLYAVACFYGFAAAGVQALYASAAHGGSMYAPQVTGQKAGLVLAVVSFACLTGPPIGGVLVGVGHGRYLYAQLFAGSSLVMGGMLLLVSRYLRVGLTARSP